VNLAVKVERSSCVQREGYTLLHLLGKEALSGFGKKEAETVFKEINNNNVLL